MDNQSYDFVIVHHKNLHTLLDKPDFSKTHSTCDAYPIALNQLRLAPVSASGELLLGSADA